MSQSLLRIAQTYGTPAYAYDLDALRRQIAWLLRSYPADRIRYSLKANPSAVLCSFIAAAGLEADVSSAGELATALKAGFSPSRICLSGPYKSPELLDRVARVGGVTLSIDSLSELAQLAKKGHRHRIVLRLKQGIAAGRGDPVERFGIDVCDLPRCRELLPHFEFAGFHVYSRSQILQPDLVIENLRRGLELARQAAEALGSKPALINFGAGLGVPYKIDDAPLDFEALAAEMKRVSNLLAPAPVVLELGRFVVAEAGWYLTSVVGHQRRGELEAVVVDGGSHQRSDLCGIGLRSGCRAPIVLSNRSAPPRWTSILGSLCLPSDILADKVLLPPLELGDVLAFGNAGAYGATASPLDFLGHSHPVEAVFEGDRIGLPHEFKPGEVVLQRQGALSI
jgi:diaminopimelate decarboxylase